MTQQPQGRAEAENRASATPAGLVRALAFVGAALSLVFYLLGFVSDVGTTGLVGALVIGGGLLAGAGALPRSGGRLPAPAAVVSIVGLLALVQVVVSSRITGLLLGALAVAFLETVAVVGAMLADAGVLGAPARRPKPAAPVVENAPYGGVSPDQAWTQEHLGALHQSSSPTTVYGAPPQYGGVPDNTALIGAPASGAFPAGEPGSVPAFGLSAGSAPKDATEVVPASAYGATAVNGAVAGERSPTPADAAFGAGAVNGATGGERGPDAPAPSYGMTGANAVYGLGGAGGQGEAQTPMYGLTGSTPLNGAAAGGPSPGDAQASPYGLTGATPLNGAAAGGQASGEAQAPLYGLTGANPLNGAAAAGQASGAPQLYGLGGPTTANPTTPGERGQAVAEARQSPYGVGAANSVTAGERGRPAADAQQSPQGAAAAKGATAGQRGQTAADAQQSPYGVGAANGATAGERARSSADAQQSPYGAGAANGVAAGQRGQTAAGTQQSPYGTAAGATAGEHGRSAADAQQSPYGTGSVNGATAGARGEAAQALGEGQAPLYGLSGASAINGTQPPERGPSGASPGVAGEGSAPLYGLTGRNASGTGGRPGQAGQTQNGAADPSAARYSGANGQPVQNPGAPGERSPQYGLTGSHATPAERSTTSGPAHAVPAEGPALLQGLTGRSRPTETGPSGVPADAPLYGLSGPGQGGHAGEREKQAYGRPGERSAPQYGRPGAANERSWSGYNVPAEAQASPYGSAGERGQTPTSDGSVQLSGLSGTPGPVNGHASTSGASHAVPGGAAPSPFGRANGTNAAAVGGPTPQSSPPPLYGLSGTGAPQAGVTGSGPSHAAPAFGTSGERAARPGSSSSGAHHAPTGEFPVYGAPGNGAASSGPGVSRAASGTGDAAQPGHGQPTAGPSNGRPSPSSTASYGEAASPRPGSAPSAAPPSNPAMRPPDVARGNPKTGPETTALRVQRAWAESDATPAMGQASSGAPDATMVAAPGWLGEADGSADPSGKPDQGAPGRAGRHGSPRGGRHGQPDDGRPDPTQVFPNPDR